MAHNNIKNKSLLSFHDQQLWPDRIATLREEMTQMPVDEMYRVLLELEDKHPETFASLQKACHSLVSQNEDPNLKSFIKSVRETVTEKDGTKQKESAASTGDSGYAGDEDKDDNNNDKDQLKETKKKDPFILLRFLYESPREYRKCANDDDNMFSNYVDRVVYAMIPNSRNGKCGDCRFQSLTEAKSIKELLVMVRKLKVTRRFCDEIVSSLLERISNSAKCKKDALRAELLFKESRDLLLKGNPTDALSRIQKSLLKSKPETQSYKYALRAVILNELCLTSDSAIDWSTAVQYGFQRKVFCDQTGYSDVIQTKLDQVIALSSCSSKSFSKSDIIQYHNFPRPVQSGNLLPEATDRVEIVEQVSSDGVRKGCRLCASRKINAGEVILTERSFGSVLTRNSIPHRCFNCLIAISKRFVPCSHCQLVRYCTESCRSQDWDNSHEQLCPLLDLLNFFPAGQAVIKLLIQNGIESVVLKNRKKSDLLQKPLSNDLESFFAYRVTLSCSPWTRLNFSLTALLLTKMAFKFLDPGQVTESKLSAVLLEMLMIMHETREALIEDVGKVRKRYGTFVSPVYRMLPICCQPNTLTQQLGDRTALIAAKRIDVGEEIRIH